MHSGDLVYGIFSRALCPPVAHTSRQADFAVIHFHLDVTGVDIAMGRQPLAHVFTNPLVCAPIALGTAPSVVTLRVRSHPPPVLRCPGVTADSACRTIAAMSSVISSFGPSAAASI